MIGPPGTGQRRDRKSRFAPNGIPWERRRSDTSLRLGLDDSANGNGHCSVRLEFGFVGSGCRPYNGLPWPNHPPKRRRSRPDVDEGAPPLSRRPWPTRMPGTGLIGKRKRRRRACVNLNASANSTTAMAKVNLYPDFREFLESLNLAGVKYLLLGGYAVIHYGYRRA